MSTLTDQEREALRGNVARGYAYLIDKIPDLRSRVDCELLDLDHADYCVLGQVYGTFHVGLYYLKRSDRWAVAHGLVPPRSIADDDRYEEAVQVLTEEWRRLLTH